MASNGPINNSLFDELDQDFAGSGSESEDDFSDARADHAVKNGERQERDGDDMDVDEADSKTSLSDSRWKELNDILQKIEENKSRPPAASTGSLDGDPQYDLLAQANSFSTNIDDHMQELLKRIRDLYSARFPELETLLPDPLEYIKAVAIIGNGPMDGLKNITSSSENLVHQPLNTILSRPKLMTVTVEATTTRGHALSEQHLLMTQSDCSKMLKLESAKLTIQSFVESRMNIFCPNLTILLGSTTAAQLITAKGGLKGLACTSGSVIPSIGSKRFAASGLATNTGVRNQGHLFHTDIVKAVRSDHKKKIMNVLSNKLVLAARMDHERAHPDGSFGADMLEYVEKEVDRLSQANPNAGQKALPAPDDKPSKKRGGRRARAQKALTVQTELAKQRNRMGFNQEEAEVGYGMGEGTAGMGMVGKGNDGRVRAQKIDERTRAKVSKKNAGWGAGTATGAGAASSLRGIGAGAGAHGLRTAGVATSLGTGTVGTASSLAFGQRQGLELVDPKARAELERKDRAEADRYFKGGTFTQVATTNGGANADGFRKPALPSAAGTKRKADSAS